MVSKRILRRAMRFVSTWQLFMNPRHWIFNKPRGAH